MTIHHFPALLALSGSWQGHNRLQTAAADPIQESSSLLTVTPIENDTLVRIDQSWNYQNEPQTGSMLIGHDGNTGAITIHWRDTCHNATKIMQLHGQFETQRGLVATGHFAVGSGPDWRWRIEIRVSDQQLHIDMFCVNFDSAIDDGGVRATYVRD